MKRIYLDYAASTPTDPAVFAAMEPYFREKFGNPGSLHSFGQEAIAAVDIARETIGKAIGAAFREIIFTASATEANNLALRGAVRQFKKLHPGIVPKIIVSAIEHESVLETARDLAAEGVEVAYIPVDADGVVSLKKCKELLDDQTVLISVMYANNETGAIAPIAELAETVKIFRERNGESRLFPLFHTDAAQAFQFLDCSARTLGVDLMTLSSHKIYGPKGAGALYIKNLETIAPLTTGGGQEFGVRSGTENVPAIVGFAKAVELAAATREKEAARIEGLKKYFWEALIKIVPAAELNAPMGAASLPNILNVYFPGVEAQDMLTKLDLKDVAASSGSACRSRAIEASYVLEAVGHSKERARQSIRFSFGRPTTKEELDAALAAIAG